MGIYKKGWKYTLWMCSSHRLSMWVCSSAYCTFKWVTRSTYTHLCGEITGLDHKLFGTSFLSTFILITPISFFLSVFLWNAWTNTENTVWLFASHLLHYHVILCASCLFNLNTTHIVIIPTCLAKETIRKKREFTHAVLYIKYVERCAVCMGKCKYE